MGFFSQLFGSGNDDKRDPQESPLREDVLRAINSCNPQSLIKAFRDFAAMGEADAKAAGKEFFVRREFSDGWDQFRKNPSKESLKRWFLMAPGSETVLLGLIKLSGESYSEEVKAEPFKLQIEKNETVHAPISLTKELSMPAAFTGSMYQEGKGQIWVSGDFFVVFDVRPLTIKQTQAMMEGAKVVPPSVINHTHSASAYYRLSKNPNGSSKLPIHVLSVESSRLQSGFFLNSYTAEGRHNFGSVGEPTDDNEICNLFVHMMRDILELEDDFIFAGSSDENWESPAVR